MSRARNLLFALVLATVAALALSGSVAAQKVGNPGTINFKMTSGALKVKTNEFTLDTSKNINFNGTVSANGAVNIPSISFPKYEMQASGYDLDIFINVVGPTTGTINPLTGAVSLVLKVWIKIDGLPSGFPISAGNCKIANSSNPITLNTMITGTSGPLTGIPYNPSNGTMRIVNGNYAVPTASDCGLAASSVNDALGLASGAGQNTASFDLTATPVITRAINPVFAATPASGTAPAAVNFSAAGTTLSSGPASYSWDFQNDGTFDQTGAANTASTTYTTGGTKTVRLRVTDSGGDWAETTRTVSITAHPDLAITAAANGEFTVGSDGVYRINMANQGYAATGPVTVKSTLPPGLNFVSGSGSGWSCSAAGQDVTCTRTSAVAVNASAPELGITVATGKPAYPSAGTTFSVETTGDSQASNNSATVTTTVRGADLRPQVTQISHAMLPGTAPENELELRVSNTGDAVNSGPVTVTSELPAGLTPVSADGGSSWTCDVSGQIVSCVTSDPIAAGNWTPPVVITVDASLEPGSPGATVESTAVVSNQFDVDSANDTARRNVLILDGPDVAVEKLSLGDFTAGSSETYSIAVRNFGPRPTTGGVTVTDQLPESLQFVSADGGPDWSCDEQDQTVTCVHSGEIEPGGSAEITLTVDVGVDAIPSVSNTATVTTDIDPNPANDQYTDTAVVRAIDMTVAKSHQGELRVGQNETFTLAVENVGDSATVAPVTVTDQLPTGLDFVSVDGGPAWACDPVVDGLVTCQHAASIAPGDEVPPVDVAVNVLPSAAPSITNEATVSTPSDFNPDNDQTSDSGDVIDVDAGVTIGRTGTFNPGRTGTYLIHTANVGAVASSGPLEVETTLGPGLEFVDADGNGWTCGENGGVVTCEGHDGLASGATAPAIQLRVDVTTAAVPASTTVARVSTPDDRFSPNDEASDTATVLGPDLSIAAANEGPFRVGGTADWEVTVTNSGPGITTGPVTVTDQLPTGFTFLRAQGTGWSCANSGQTVSCERTAAIAANAPVPAISVEAEIGAAALPAGEVSATVDHVISVATESDIDPANDEVADPIAFAGTDLGIDLAGPAEIGVGDVAEFELGVSGNSVANQGPIEVETIFPVGFSTRDFSGDGWNCEGTGRKFNCQHQSSLAAGETAPVLTVRARVGERAPASAVTEARLRTTGDVIAANDSATVTTTTLTRPDLGVGLAAITARGSFVLGSDGAYRATIRNHGSAPTSDPVRAVLSLPAGLEFVAVDRGSGWVCVAADAAVTCENPGTIPPGGMLELGLRVGLAGPITGPVTTGIEVEATGDLETGNNTASATTGVSRIDLAVTRGHLPVWSAGREGVYEVQVVNVGTAPTMAPAVISERLPAGTEFRLATGNDWSCSVSGRTLRCAGPPVIEPGEVSDLRVTLGLPNAPNGFDATTTVSTTDDFERSNDSATESIEISPSSAGAVTKPARLTTSRVRPTRSGLVLLWLFCPKDSGSKCQGRVRLDSAGKVKVKNGRAKVALGSTRFAVAPGRKSPVRIRLKKQGQVALRQLGRLKVRATVNNRSADQTRRMLTIRRSGR